MYKGWIAISIVVVVAAYCIADFIYKRTTYAHITHISLLQMLFDAGNRGEFNIFQELSFLEKKVGAFFSMFICLIKMGQRKLMCSFFTRLVCMFLKVKTIAAGFLVQQTVGCGLNPYPRVKGALLIRRNFLIQFSRMHCIFGN